MDIQEDRVETLTGSATNAPRAEQSGASPALWPAGPAQPVMPVYNVEDQLRRRTARALAGRVALGLLDVVMMNVAFFLAYSLRYNLLQGVTITNGFIRQDYADFLSLQFVTVFGILALFYLRGLYRLRPTGAWFKQFWHIVAAATTGFAILSAYEYLFQGTDLLLNQNRLIVAADWIAIIVMVSFARLLVSGILSAFYRRGVGLTNLLVVGSGRLGKLMMQQIAATPTLGYRVVGFIHDMDGQPADFGRFKALGTMRELDAVIRGYHTDEVIIALPSHQHQQILRTVRVCERAGANYKLVPDLYELSLSRIDVDSIEGIPLIGLKRSLTSSFQHRLKRLVDIAGAGAILIIGSPVWLLIALAIKLDSPGPVLYKQTRIGYRGQPFPFLKFRSMHVNADHLLAKMRMSQPQGDERGKFKLRDDPRRTRVGRFIRPLSLDEIPQFLNVLRGDMSLVGPRPPLPSEVERYEDWEKARLEVPVGITGLWQVRGRSDIDFDEMVLMDLYYVENWSLRLDFQILLQTIPAVLSRRGAY